MKKINYLLSIFMLVFATTVLGQETTSKEKFHIYLAFGQSNMEGQNWSGTSVSYSDVIPAEYKQNVDPRWQVMAAIGGRYNLATGIEQRTEGNWYTAVPPLVRHNTGLCPADYFGRVLVEGIPDPEVKVGVIVVAVAGAAINGFEKGQGANDYFATQPSWMQNIAALYNNNPYNHLITLAQQAQEVGVIKGIIMHQGESGAVGGNWAQKVQGIYNNMLEDLGLEANSIPFLAGQAYGGGNSTINALPNTFNTTLPNGKNVANVISSSGCPTNGDNLHFSYEGYKMLGERYGEKMLELVYNAMLPGFKLSASPSPSGSGSVTIDPAPTNGRYEEDTEVTLTAEPAFGYKFDGWSGDATGNKNPLTVTMDANKNITAKFLPSISDGENIIKNGNFINTQNWSLQAYNGAAATWSVADGKAMIDITATGTSVFAGENCSYTFNQGILTSGFYIVQVRSSGSVEQAKVVIS